LRTWKRQCLWGHPPWLRLKFHQTMTSTKKFSVGFKANRTEWTPRKELIVSSYVSVKVHFGKIYIGFSKVVQLLRQRVKKLEGGCPNENAFLFQQLQASDQLYGNHLRAIVFTQQHVNNCSHAECGSLTTAKFCMRFKLEPSVPICFWQWTVLGAWFTLCRNFAEISQSSRKQLSGPDLILGQLKNDLRHLSLFIDFGGFCNKLGPLQKG
jgi:hypothetical protein